MWLDISSPNSIIGSHFHGKIVSEGEAIYTELNKPNAPVLASGMIPIKYDGTKWVKADTSNTNNSWYNYDNKEWANVALVSDSKIVENITTNKSVTINNQSNTYTTYSSFSSTNGSVHSSTSSSTITVNIHSSGTFGFRSIVSSESNYDKLTVKVKKNSDAETTVSNAISGSNSNNYSDSTAKSGDVYVITVSYTKDSSVSSGNDKGTLDTFTYPANTHVTIAGSGSYPWVASGATNNTVYDNKIGTGITYNTSTQKYDLVSPTSSVISSSTIGKYVCPTITQTSCTTAYKVTAASTSITKVDEYSSSTATGTRADYLNAEVGTEIKEEDILAYYVWIPRYKYKIWNLGESSQGQEQTIDIVFESTDSISTGTGVGEYITHPAFWWDNDSDGVRDTGEELAGIWVGKFETTGTADSPTILPDVTSLRNQKVSVQFATAQKLGGTTYGVSSNVDSHMMKSSEWGSISYLSNSKYGINREVYINNSSEYYTGRSGGNVSGSTPINETYTDQTSTSTYNSYGFYTWDGYLLNYDTNTKSTTRNLTKIASTTGNITGIYDMAGGAIEAVMGVFANSDGQLWSGQATYANSGFTGLVGESGTSYSGTSFPESKYYDVYRASSGITIDKLTACNGRICYGHALSETSNWYGDGTGFVSAVNSWATRGGAHWYDAGAGLFHSGYANGKGDSVIGFRSSLVVK